MSKVQQMARLEKASKPTSAGEAVIWQLQCWERREDLQKGPARYFALYGKLYTARWCGRPALLAWLQDEEMGARAGVAECADFGAARAGPGLI